MGEAAAHPIREYDPYSYAIDEDPYPVYRWLREEHPIYYNERLNFWAVSRYEDCARAFLDWETFSSARGTVLELMDGPVPGPMIIFMDPPRTTRLRNLVSKAFTPRRIAELEPHIRRLAVEHLEPLVGRGRCDIVRDFTAKLPMDVISTLLGIPAADRDMVRGWSNDILHREPDRPEPPPRALEAMRALFDYFTEALEERRRRPRDDVMTQLLVAELADEEGGRTRLSEQEIKAFINLLATAGNETVTKLLASAVYWLEVYPEQRQRLLDDPALIPGAVEEMLRFDPPSQYQGRVLTRAAEFHGTRVPEGGRLLILNAASGRDERVYRDPDRLDVGREIDLHMNFGHGQHVCLGKNLARMESRIALEEFLRRFPRYAVDEAGAERFHSSNVRGFAALPLLY